MIRILAQLTNPSAQLIEQLDKMREPVSHSAVIAAFGLIVISLLLWLVRKQAGDKLEMVNKLLGVLTANAKVSEEVIVALLKLQGAIDRLTEKEKDVDRMFLTHPCLMLDSKHRQRFMEILNSLNYADELNRIENQDKQDNLNRT